MIRLFILIVVSGVVSMANAQICSTWSAPIKAGFLDKKRLKEASGLGVSKQFSNRFYHHNDSGATGIFYVTDLSGAHTKEIIFTHDKVTDVEDVSVGPCATGQCIYLGDIGDNDLLRPSIDLWVIPETNQLSNVTDTAKKITLTYPDRPHNAESLVVHPVTGDIYILTKELDKVAQRAQPAMLFKLPQSALGQSKVVLQAVANLDLPWINHNFEYHGQIATSMDISPNAKNLLVLTYDNAVEINLDKIINSPSDTRTWKQDVDYKVLPLEKLLSQQEAVAYSSDGRSFYFDSEFNKKEGDTESPIYRMDCLAP